MKLEELFRKHPEVVDQMLYDFEDELSQGEYQEDFTEEARDFLGELQPILAALFKDLDWP